MLRRLCPQMFPFLKSTVAESMSAACLSTAVGYLHFPRRDEIEPADVKIVLF